MKSLKRNFKNTVFPLLIIAIVITVSWKNYVPGTWLSGWDSLHPEFNLPLYLKRAFSGVWQEHQGVGAFASQAHATEIPRLLIVFLISLITSISSVRYIFFFLSLGVGALGVYCFTHYLLEKIEKNFVRQSSFIASLFYIFNLTTIQHFYVPLEMFAVHFALLPWLFYLATKYLEEGKKKILLLFSIATIFSASMAHTPTLYYVYIVSLFVYLSFVLILKRRKTQLKRVLSVLLVTFTLNLYWILPNIYFVTDHSTDVSNSKIHQNFSEEAFLQSKDYGDLKSLALQKNFLFNWREYNFESDQFVDLLDEWKIHLEKPGVEIIGILLFGASLLGVYISLKKKSIYAISLLPVLFISIFFWVNSNPPFGDIFDYLRDNYSLFKEGFRFPFTKFSILLIMSLSIYLGFFVQWFFEEFRKIKLSLVLFGIVVAVQVYFGYPILKGNLISPSMKVEIKQEYFDTFDWFKDKNPNARIAKLPLNSYWGWSFYDWGYQGAGFTWFGINQPTFDREFDRWSPYNESFYNQASHVLYKKDLKEFEKILEKYQVKYLTLDESVINAGGKDDVLYVKEIKSLLGASERVWEAQKIGFITIYETDVDIGNKYVWTPESYKLVDQDLTYSKIDPLFSSQRAYIQNIKGETYPFVNLDKRMGVEVKFNEEGYILKSNDLIYPNIKKLTFPEELEVNINNTTKKVEVNIKVEEKIKESFEKSRGFSEATNCDLKKLGKVTKEKLISGIKYGAYDGGVSCDFFYYPQMDRSKGHVLRIKGENKKGRGLKIYLFNPETKKMDLEELLPEGEFDEYFFILPNNTISNKKDEIDSGYTLNIETRSFGSVSSENIIEKIEIVEFPHTLISKIKLEPETQIEYTSNLVVESVRKTGTTNYKVKVSGEGLLILGQGYEDGWVAYSNGKKLKHEKVNNWQNGWIISEREGEISIFFWPQYLEWGGFILLLLTSLILVSKRKNTL